MNGYRAFCCQCDEMICHSDPMYVPNECRECEQIYCEECWDACRPHDSDGECPICEMVKRDDEKRDQKNRKRICIEALKRDKKIKKMLKKYKKLGLLLKLYELKISAEHRNDLIETEEEIGFAEDVINNNREISSDSE